MKILIIGQGYLGSRCHAEWGDSVISNDHIASIDDVLKILNTHEPDVVLNAAGIVGKPNVDWCESHQMETIQGNTILPIIIAEACQKKNIYLLHMGTGCIYYGYAEDKNGWKESDYANPVAVYTRAKYAADLVLATMPNIGIARIRMPIDSIPHPGNLINKLASFSKVIDVVNSVTLVPDMIKVFRALLEQKASGIFHVTNPGALKHKEILELYEELVDQNHHNEWIQEGDLLKQGLVNKKRSNNILQSENLAKFGIAMPEVHESLRVVMSEYARHKTNPAP
ncbi:MAG: sugar nucleotide-binding protein [Candidatus Magasanikbacteria bacterium]|nr:sugar nucleotide-binding protein [Candidatus Magasanikbacteria bacterium]